MKKKAYTKIETKKELKKLHLPWKVTPKGTQLTYAFTFKDFLEAFMFVARISVHAEVIKHHPELTLSYGSVRVKLTTHDVKGLTKADIELAERIEAAYARLISRGKH